MSQLESETITSPSGVEIQKSVIEGLFNKILEDVQDLDNTNAAANRLAADQPTASIAPMATFKAVTSMADTDNVAKRPMKKQRIEQEETNDGFFLGAENRWIFKPNDDKSPSATVPYTPPQQTLTGVSAELLKVCATICHQMYHVKTENDFDLPDGATTRFFTDHGVFSDTVPPFVMASYGNSLILAWRGSSSLVDWTSNLAYAPVSSSRWSAMAPNLRVHSSYNSLVESDLVLYHNEIMEAINKNDQVINQIVFTGHSLGGGLANVAHLIVKSQLEQEGTAWKTGCPDGLTCRTVAFAAPMTTLALESKHTGAFDPATATNMFLKKVSDNTCNIMYSFDPVPHAVADLAFLAETIKNLLPDLTGNNLLTGALLGIFGVESQIQGLLNKLYALADYHHIGKLIYYGGAAGSVPVVLRDSPLVFDATVPEFRGNTIIPVPRKQRGSVKEVEAAHTYFPEAFVDQKYRKRK